jgi:hypothetical protein
MRVALANFQSVLGVDADGAPVLGPFVTVGEHFHADHPIAVAHGDLFGPDIPDPDYGDDELVDDGQTIDTGAPSTPAPKPRKAAR